jgi:hypothetical protein
MHRGEAVLVLVEVGVELVLFRHLDDLAVGVVDPAVEAAGDHRGLVAAEGLFAGLDDDLVAAVRTGVVEAADLAVLAAHEDHRGLGEGQLLDLVVAGLAISSTRPTFSQLLRKTFWRSCS